MSVKLQSLTIILAAILLAVAWYIFWPQTNEVAAPTPEKPAATTETFVHPTDGYRLEYTSGWYPHQLGNQVIFTEQSELEIPLGSEGYAFGPQIVVRKAAITDDYTDVQNMEDFLRRVSEVGPDGAPVVAQEETIDGQLFWRVERTASLAEGQEVIYYYLISPEEFVSFYHWPYEKGSERAQVYMDMIESFTLEQVKSSAEIDGQPQACETAADCGLLICSGCFNKTWLETAPPDLACRQYEGYRCDCVDSICTAVKQ